MDKTNINVLVQSIERSLHLICKKLFSFKQEKFIQIWPEFNFVKCISLKKPRYLNILGGMRKCSYFRTIGRSFTQMIAYFLVMDTKGVPS